MEGQEDTVMSTLSIVSNNEVEPEIHKEKLKPPDFRNIPDVIRVSLKRTTQKRLHLWADDDITADKPLKFVPKKNLIADIQEHISDSELASVLNPVKTYPEDEILFIYLANSEIPNYEYYVVTTVETKNQILKQFNDYQDKLKKELMKYVLKDVGTWCSLGSEDDVNQLNEDQRYRALFEVEIESKFPVLGETIKFSNRNVEDAIDGYVEIVPYREKFNNVERLRVDCPVQVSLPKKNVSIQTTLTFPTNAWTQYQYEYTPPVEIPVIVKKGQPKPKTPLERFLNPDFLESIYHQLVYNWEVNLYRDDYPKLCVDEDTSTLVEKYNELMSFVDVEKCTGKLISSCDWSYVRVGQFLATYVDFTTHNIMNTRPVRDEIYRAIYGINPVLMWSSQNSLKPILELESPREVTHAAFCPYDSLVAAGCVNGQIIVWDQTICSEEKSIEILTSAQQKYRTIIQRKTTWFKNVKNSKSVRPACVSNLQYGHRSPISTVQWLPSQYRIERYGQVEIVEDPVNNPSYQFVTTGYDGFVCFWDLKFIPPESESKARVNVSKRLGKRLSALNIDVSRFRVLNHILKPIYKLSINTDDVCNASITSVSFNFPEMKYENITNPKSVPKNFTTANKFKPCISENVPPFKKEFICAFVRGVVAKISWEGFEVDSGADVNIEKAHVERFAKVHDGPVTSVLRSPFFEEIFLTVGGSVFALWETNFTSYTLLFRRKECRITTCSWSPCRPGCFHLGLEDGTFEVWDITNKSDEATFTQSISGKALTIAETHRLPLQTQVIGIADYRGSFRIFEVPKPLSMHSVSHAIDLRGILDSAKNRKLKFTNWEKDWKERYKKELDEYKQKLQKLADEKRKAIEEEAIRAQKLKEKELEEMKKKALLESKPQPGKYEEWAQKKFDKMQSIHMHNVLLKKKGLKREDLVEFLAPLTRISEQKEAKTKKETVLLDMKEKIYNDFIETTFSASIELKSLSEVADKVESKEFTHPKEYYDDFVQSQQKILEKLKGYQYDVPFNWLESLKTGLERRKMIDVGLMVNLKHRKRFEDEREHLSKDIKPEKQPIIKEPSEGVMIKRPSQVKFQTSTELLITEEVEE